MRRLSYGILFGILGLCVVGCTGVPYRDAKSSIPPLAPDQARITMFRESRFFGSAMKFAVSIDGVYVGLLPSGSVLTVDHAPGDLYLLARAPWPSVANASITLNAQRGQEYFVEIGTAPDCGVYAGSEPG